MRACLEDATDANAKKDCRDKAAAALVKATGKELSKGEQKAKLERAASSEAAARMKACLEDANDANAKKDCRDKAAAALVKATGKELSKGEQKAKLERAASSEAAQSMQACLEDATDANAKQ